MRIRRWWCGWGGAALVCTCLVLYLLADAQLNRADGPAAPVIAAPGAARAPAPPLPDSEEKWNSFAERLKKLERELSDHNAAVGDIRDAMRKLVDKETDDRREPPESGIRPKPKAPPKIAPAPVRRCPARADGIPSVDVQMMDVYERLQFDNPDGGVWKQGWPIKYDAHQWNYGHKLKVFVVPHSHNDPGWLKTFEEYFASLSRNILDRMLSALSDDPRRKFIWAEISFFSLWWEKLNEERRKAVGRLLRSGQLEIVTGGWVMNDEANSHWYSIMQQLSGGHQWLRRNLDVTPVSGWAIDPFGHSATQPYLLKLAGLNASLIQRTHYSIKKEFAKNKGLEFNWRQLWDGSGVTDMFTHMMPFYSYDIPHTCGPDPKICCQFDFKRLPGYGLTCPWKIPPQVITERNVKAKSELILDQWRKKAQLYKTRTVLVPLGDDFRWDHPTEWDAQFNNYDRIMDYLNNNDSYYVEVRYGTLSDYFNSVSSEMSSNNFPTLSGDFFTYADRDDHYWSGYYTSRPFYKRMDRVLMYYVRSAEIILAISKSRQDVPPTLLSPEFGLLKKLTEAKQSLALFQHHDGVTGTSRDLVVIDYGNKLLKAISLCQHIIQQSAYHLLVQPELFKASPEQVYFEIDDVRRTHSSLPERLTITVGAEAPSRKIVFFNSLPYTREEVVTLFVSTPFITIVDTDGVPIKCQISPVFVSETTISHSKFRLDFIASIPGLSLSSYIVTAVEEKAITSSTTYSKVKMLNFENIISLHPAFPEIETVSPGLSGDFSVLRPGSQSMTASFSPTGLLKAVQIGNRPTMPLHLDFIKYGTRSSGDKSGAYLFLPGSQGNILRNDNIHPIITVIEGAFVNSVTVQFPHIQHTVTLYGGTGADSLGLEVLNLVDIGTAHNLELAMRLSTSINNLDRFYTDLNGFQMIRRKTFKKLPLQGNFYPLPTAAYIEDDSVRLSLLTSTSLGVAALQPGQIEIMQDRRLDQDDNRGLGQGVLNNHPTHHKFNILVEYKSSGCQSISEEHPAGLLSIGAHVASQSLLNPLVPLFYSGDGSSERAGPEEQQGTNLISRFIPMETDAQVDLTLASYTDGILATLPNGKKKEGRGLVLHRQILDSCYGTDQIRKEWKQSDDIIKLMDLLPVSEVDDMYNSSLSYLHLYHPLDPAVPQYICPGEVKTYFFYR